ncbi:MAG: YHS domain-containing protein [Rhodobacteraceae bacterium]|nr:YHS domain-containing protein [Paracoccaceae bacterium]
MVEFDHTARGWSGHETDAFASTRHRNRGVFRDPVCGMIVDPQPDTPQAQHGGYIYHFCSAACQSKFAADPANRICIRIERICEFLGLLRTENTFLICQRRRSRKWP